MSNFLPPIHREQPKEQDTRGTTSADTLEKIPPKPSRKRPSSASGVTSLPAADAALHKPTPPKDQRPEGAARRKKKQPRSTDKHRSGDSAEHTTTAQQHAARTAGLLSQAESLVKASLGTVVAAQSPSHNITEVAATETAVYQKKQAEMDEWLNRELDRLRADSDDEYTPPPTPPKSTAAVTSIRDTTGYYDTNDSNNNNNNTKSKRKTVHTNSTGNSVQLREEGTKRPEDEEAARLKGYYSQMRVAEDRKSETDNRDKNETGTREWKQAQSEAVERKTSLRTEISTVKHTMTDVERLLTMDAEERQEKLRREEAEKKRIEDKIREEQEWLESRKDALRIASEESERSSEDERRRDEVEYKTVGKYRKTKPKSTHPINEEPITISTAPNSKQVYAAQEAERDVVALAVPIPNLSAVSHAAPPQQYPKDNVEEEEGHAATKIQAMYKGRAARKEYDQKQKNSDKEQQRENWARQMGEEVRTTPNPINPKPEPGLSQEAESLKANLQATAQQLAEERQHELRAAYQRQQEQNTAKENREKADAEKRNNVVHIMTQREKGDLERVDQERAAQTQREQALVAKKKRDQQAHDEQVRLEVEDQMKQKRQEWKAERKEEQVKEQDEAAVKIQAVFKGRLARKQFEATLKPSKQAALPDPLPEDDTPSPPPSVEMSEVEAATRIQALFKGHKARKEYETYHKPSTKSSMADPLLEDDDDDIDDDDSVDLSTVPASKRSQVEAARKRKQEEVHKLMQDQIQWEDRNNVYTEADGDTDAWLRLYKDDVNRNNPEKWDAGAYQRTKAQLERRLLHCNKLMDVQNGKRSELTSTYKENTKKTKGAIQREVHSEGYQQQQGASLRAAQRKELEQFNAAIAIQRWYLQEQYRVGVQMAEINWMKSELEKELADITGTRVRSAPSVKSLSPPVAAEQPATSYKKELEKQLQRELQQLPMSEAFSKLHEIQHVERYAIAIQEEDARQLIYDVWDAWRADEKKQKRDQIRLEEEREKHRVDQQKRLIVGESETRSRIQSGQRSEWFELTYSQWQYEIMETTRKERRREIKAAADYNRKIKQELEDEMLALPFDEAITKLIKSEKLDRTGVLWDEEINRNDCLVPILGMQLIVSNRQEFIRNNSIVAIACKIGHPESMTVLPYVQDGIEDGCDIGPIQIQILERSPKHAELIGLRIIEVIRRGPSDLAHLGIVAITDLAGKTTHDWAEAMQREKGQQTPEEPQIGGNNKDPLRPASSEIDPDTLKMRHNMIAELHKEAEREQRADQKRKDQAQQQWEWCETERKKEENDKAVQEAAGDGGGRLPTPPSSARPVSTDGRYKSTPPPPTPPPPATTTTTTTAMDSANLGSSYTHDWEHERRQVQRLVQQEQMHQVRPVYTKMVVAQPDAEKVTDVPLTSPKPKKSQNTVVATCLSPTPPTPIHQLTALEEFAPTKPSTPSSKGSRKSEYIPPAALQAASAPKHTTQPKSRKAPTPPQKQGVYKPVYTPTTSQQKVSAVGMPPVPPMEPPKAVSSAPPPHRRMKAARGATTTSSNSSVAANNGKPTTPHKVQTPSSGTKQRKHQQLHSTEPQQRTTTVDTTTPKAQQNLHTYSPHPPPPIVDEKQEEAQPEHNQEGGVMHYRAGGGRRPSLKASMAEPLPEEDTTEHTLPTGQLQPEQQAATKIQALFKGHKTRSEFELKHHPSMKSSMARPLPEDDNSTTACVGEEGRKEGVVVNVTSPACESQKEDRKEDYDTTLWLLQKNEVGDRHIVVEAEEAEREQLEDMQATEHGKVVMDLYNELVQDQTESEMADCPTHTPPPPEEERREDIVNVEEQHHHTRSNKDEERRESDAYHCELHEHIPQLLGVTTLETDQTNTRQAISEQEDAERDHLSDVEGNQREELVTKLYNTIVLPPNREPVPTQPTPHYSYMSTTNVLPANNHPETKLWDEKQDGEDPVLAQERVVRMAIITVEGKARRDLAGSSKWWLDTFGQHINMRARFEAEETMSRSLLTSTQIQCLAIIAQDFLKAIILLERSHYERWEIQERTSIELYKNRITQYYFRWNQMILSLADSEELHRSYIEEGESRSRNKLYMLEEAMGRDQREECVFGGEAVDRAVLMQEQRNAIDQVGDVAAFSWRDALAIDFLRTDIFTKEHTDRLMLERDYHTVLYLTVGLRDLAIQEYYRRIGIEDLHVREFTKLCILFEEATPIAWQASWTGLFDRETRGRKEVEQQYNSVFSIWDQAKVLVTNNMVEFSKVLEYCNKWLSDESAKQRPSGTYHNSQDRSKSLDRLAAPPANWDIFQSPGGTVLLTV